MRTIYCLMILLCPLMSIGQMPSGLAPLKIGERVPDIELHSVLNAPFSTTSLAAFDHKLLLVDFWATWCASCIREFPKLDTLNKIFKNKLGLLLVNNPKSGDSEKKIKEFFDKKRLPSGNRYGMAVVLGDTQLSQLFPHLSIPHTVWIYKGKFIAVTQAADVTVLNIRAVLDNKSVAFENKEDQMDFDIHKPLVENGNGGTAAAVLYRSVFTRFLKGAGSVAGEDAVAGSPNKRRFFINQPMLRLYQFVFPALNTNRVILDSALYPMVICDTPNTRWKIAYNCCYEQTLSAGTNAADQQRYMQVDLDRQFGIQSRLEKKLVTCYVLVLKDSTRLKNSIAPSGAVGIQKLDNGYWAVKNRSLADLVWQMNFQSFGKPFYPVVLDETGYAEPVSMGLGIKNIHDIPGLQKILPAFGLELKAAERWVEMLVISKN